MILVMIAAYNEERGLAELLPRLPRLVNEHTVEVVVLSDGSIDRTVEIAESFGCKVLHSEKNRGKGAVLKDGLAAVGGEPFDVLVLMDGDGQHDPERLSAITSEVLAGTADVVVGSRYKNGAGRGSAPWNRYIVRCTATFVLDVVLSAGVTDPFCGFRALSPKAVSCIELHGDRYESELEMLFSAERNGLRIAEVAIPKLYGPDTSKMAVRYGAVIGRADVVARYAYTILRETTRLVLDPRSDAKDPVSS